MSYRIVAGADGSPHSTAALRRAVGQAVGRGGAASASCPVVLVKRPDHAQ
jgi:nucleotide-binding universal stress UspA family protein